MKDYSSPAFPVATWDKEKMRYVNDGMTLRDYFAAKAMQGICAHPDVWGQQTDGIAREAYAIADAMLVAREK